MKFFSGLNVWALVLAAAVSFIFGGLWYTALSKAWMAALGLTEQDIKSRGGPSPRPYVITLAAQIWMAWILAGLILHMTRSGLPTGWRSGLISGAFIWAGFIAPVLLVNYQFQMRKWGLFIIDSGHWLGVLLIQGAIIGWLGLQ